MADDLTFLMGKTPAALPADRMYARNHMWGQLQPDGRWRFGFTSYAIKLMKDVYFLSWAVDAGDDVRAREEIGHIETSKAESDLFAPLSGKLARFNDALLNDPSAINVDGHGAGWLFEVEADGPVPLMDAVGYHAFLTTGWDDTQRMLKGKFNADGE